MSIYNPSKMTKFTNARADDVNRELVKIEAAIEEVARRLQEIITGGPSPEPVPLYVWRAYANSPDGVVDFTTGLPNGHSYIGFAFNRLIATPSQFPEDYEWSPINGQAGDFVASDTINVAGQPATKIVDDLALLSLQLLAYQFDRQTLKDYVDAKLFVDGEPVNTVIVSEKSQREGADTAIAETISLIGAKTPDGSAFLIDLNKTYVSPTISLGVRLENMVAATSNTQANVQTLQQTIASFDYAEATDLALLGAKSLDGSAFILNMSTVRTGTSETLSQYINTQVAAAAGNAASVTQLYEALVTPTGGASAKAILQLDVNGRVVGTYATNNGTLGQLRLRFDSTIIEDTAGNALFIAEGGVVKMPNVEVQRLKVDSIDSPALKQTSIRKSYAAELGSNFAIPYSNATKEVAFLNVTKDLASSDMEIEFLMRMRVGRWAGYFQIVKDGAILDTLWFWAPEPSEIASLNSFRTTMPYRRRFAAAAGAARWSVQMVHFGNNNTGGFLEAGSGFYAEEIKR